MTVLLEQYLAVEGQPVVARERSAAGPDRFWTRLQQAARWLRVEYGAERAGPRLTELLGSSSHGRILFVGDIQGRQLEPLVETLRALSTGQLEFDTPATPSRLSELPGPVSLTVVLSPTCPFCPRVAAQAARLACASARVGVVVQRADAVAPPLRVAAIPSVLVGREVVATGAVGEYALVDRVVQRAGE
jgi:thiol-disulfide isomerase/thioredoxin